MSTGLMGGKTVDNVEELEILLYDGSVMTVGPTEDQELGRVIAAGGRKGQLYAGLKQLRDQYGDLVRQKFPDIPRRVSGYNLDGSLDKALQRCVGIGACHKKDAGTMCPSYQVTLEEKHSTRGRTHLLWEMLQGEIIKGGWRDDEVKESLDLCLACKGCKGECPVNVDMATYKAEFLSHYYAAHPRPLNHYAFGMMDKWARLASFVRQPRHLAEVLQIALRQAVHAKSGS